MVHATNEFGSSARSVHFPVRNSWRNNFLESSLETKSTSCVTNHGPLFPWELGTVETFPLLKSTILTSLDCCSPSRFPDTVELTVSRLPSGDQSGACAFSVSLRGVPPFMLIT